VFRRTLLTSVPYSLSGIIFLLTTICSDTDNSRGSFVRSFISPKAAFRTGEIEGDRKSMASAVLSKVGFPRRARLASSTGSFAG
jgi:hypothetical protein